MRTYRKYSKEILQAHVAEVFSMAGLLKSFGLKQAGGNYRNMWKLLAQFNISCSHWTGQSWNKAKQLKSWENYSKSSNFKEHLIVSRGARCEKCQLSYWFKYPIKLEIHHIDGCPTNNSFQNLQLLCPNCHSLTDNWRGRKQIKIIKTIHTEQTTNYETKQNSKRPTQI